MNRQIILDRLSTMRPNRGQFRWLSLLLAATMVGWNPASAQPGPPQSVPVEVVGPSPLPVTVKGGVSNDEPGRQPYRASIGFSQFGCFTIQCSNFVKSGAAILFDGPLVPSGRRLVIRHVSGYLPNDDSISLAVSLQTEQVLSLFSTTWNFFGPFFPLIGPVQGFSSDAFATVGPGERPHVHLVVPVPNNFVGQVTLSGYLIDVE